MASINRVVTVVITKGARQVPLASFSIDLIIGPSNRWGDVFRSYTSTAAMLLDGFLVGDPEYISAQALMGQAITPSSFLVGKFTAAVAQVNTFQVNTLTVSHLYSFTLNGTVISYTSAPSGDTQQSILADLLTAIGVAFPTNPPVTGAVTGSGAGATLTLTSSVAGVGVAYTAVGAQLTLASVTPNHSIVQDIVTIQAALGGNAWYGLNCTSHVDSDVLQIAAYIETQLKIYGTASSDAGIIASTTTDIAYQLSQKLYNRTWLLYSATAAAFPEAAWMGRMLPTTPGAANWKFKQLAGQTPDDQLTDTQINNAQGKNANLYLTIGNPITTEGICCSGEYIDVTVFLDWLSSTMQVNVFNALATPDKVPYTNKGIVALENPIRATLQRGQNQGGLAAGWTVTGPDILAVSSADKASRTLNNVAFAATLAGAINKINITGNVSV